MKKEVGISIIINIIIALCLFFINSLNNKNLLYMIEYSLLGMLVLCSVCFILLKKKKEDNTYLFALVYALLNMLLVSLIKFDNKSLILAAFQIVFIPLMIKVTKEEKNITENYYFILPFAVLYLVINNQITNYLYFLFYFIIIYRMSLLTKNISLFSTATLALILKVYATLMSLNLIPAGSLTSNHFDYLIPIHFIISYGINIFLNLIDNDKKLKQLDRLQMQVNQTEKFQSDFINAMNNHLSVPLQDANKYIAMAEKSAGNPAFSKAYLSKAYAKTKSTEKIMNEIALYAAIEAKNLTYQSEEINIKSIIEELLQEHRTMIDRKNLEIVTEIPESAKCVADSTYLKIAINNVIDNAIKHTSSKILIKVTRSFDDWKIEIIDDGPGIKKEHQSDIFEPYYADNEKEKSVGLGLSITKEIIKAFNGGISIDSTKDGCNFTFYLTAK